MRYLIYARVSPKGSDWAAGETSIPDQVALCRKYVTAREPDAQISVVTDQFARGDDPRRPGYSGMYGALVAGRAEWDVLVTRHLDRLWRSVSQGAEMVRLLADHAKGLVCVQQGFDFVGAAGRLQLHILLSIAEFEKSMCSERTTSRMKGIAAAGCWPVGTAPVGYKRGKAHDNVLQVDPDKAGIVQAMFRDYAAGKGGIAELGKRYSMPKQTVVHILRNPVYTGKLRYAGETHAGKHAAIVTEDLWRQVQERLPATVGKSKVYRNRADRCYLLAGLAHCDCGGVMTPGSANGRKAKYHYYQCNCGNRVQAEMLETAAVDLLGERTLAPEDVESIVAEMRRQAATAAKAVAPDLEQAAAALAAERARVRKMEQAMDDGLIDRRNAAAWNERYATAAARVGELAEHWDALKRQAAQFDATDEEWEAVVLSLRRLGDIVRLAKDCPEELRQICLTHIERVTRVEKNVYQFAMIGDVGSSQGTKWLRKKRHEGRLPGNSPPARSARNSPETSPHEPSRQALAPF